MVSELQPAEKLTLQPFPAEDDRINGQTDGVIKKGRVRGLREIKSFLLLKLLFAKYVHTFLTFTKLYVTFTFKCRQYLRLRSLSLSLFLSLSLLLSLTR